MIKLLIAIVILSLLTATLLRPKAGLILGIACLPSLVLLAYASLFLAFAYIIIASIILCFLMLLYLVISSMLPQHAGKQESRQSL